VSVARILNVGEMAAWRTLPGRWDWVQDEASSMYLQRLFAMSRLSNTLLALLVGLGISSVAGAQSATPATAPANSQSAQAATTARDGVIKPGDRQCLQQTGSRIPAKAGKCLPVTGRSYSGDELRRTGIQDNARALQTLDPSISAGH
jgi:hypothetical protein